MISVASEVSCSGFSAAEWSKLCLWDLATLISWSVPSFSPWLIHTVPGLRHLLPPEGEKGSAFALLHWHLALPCPWPLLWTSSTWFANVYYGQLSSTLGGALLAARLCCLPSLLFLGTRGLCCTESVFQAERRNSWKPSAHPLALSTKSGFFCFCSFHDIRFLFSLSFELTVQGRFSWSLSFLLCEFKLSLPNTLEQRAHF